MPRYFLSTLNMHCAILGGGCYLLKKAILTVEEAKSTDIQNFKLQDNLLTIKI